MAALTNVIEDFIKDMLAQADNGVVEIGRNELAKEFNCAPSQINYVLSTRFTAYKGYYIESRRGGSGYVRIIKVASVARGDLEKIMAESISSSITKAKARHLVEAFKEEGFISGREEVIINTAMANSSLLGSDREKNKMRAEILKNILIVLSNWEDEKEQAKKL